MSTAICPYCRTEVEESEAVACQGCATPHHADCYEENGGCTVFGCSQAPPAEPKLSIGAPDLSGPAAPPPPPRAPRPAPPPPPPSQAARQQDSALPLFSSTGYQSRVPRSVPYPAPVAAAHLQPSGFDFEPNPEARNRTVFIVLGVLLGPLGVHSFYAGYVKKGLLQLAITLLTLGMASFMIWIWAIIDICTINRDNKGIPFHS